MTATEYIALVDHKDRVIGKRPRGKEKKNTDIIRVSAVWLTNQYQEILIAQRSANKRLSPNLWGPAAVGTVESHETYEQNIQKETMEEIGLTGLVFEYGPKIRYLRNLQGGGQFTQLFFAQVEKESCNFVLQEEEVADVRWITWDKLSEEVHRTQRLSFVSSMPTLMHYVLKHYYEKNMF